MDIRKVKKLIELIEESDVEELEIKEGDDSVRISRRRAEAAPVAPAPAPMPQPQQRPQPESSGDESNGSGEKTEPDEPEGHLVRSPW